MRNQIPCVLLVGGLDPGGGAGILADARAAARAGAFACAAVSVLTVQSTSGLRAATPVPARELIAECTEVARHQRVRAIKVGALGSAENTRAIADFLARHPELPAVVDTVMVPTRGRPRLLPERAVTTLRTRVVPRTTLVTANAPEAEALTGAPVTRLEEAREAARAIVAMGCRAALVKGGHLSGPRAVDVLALEGRRGAAPRLVELAAPRLSIRPVHGGGCTLASLVAGRLAVSGEASTAAVEAAVRWAKKVHHRALAAAADVGGELRVLVP